MKAANATAIIRQERSRSAQNSTRLEGWSLWLARAAWAAVFLLILGMITLNLPYLLRDTRAEWLLSEALPAARSIFPSINSFVRYVVFLKLIAAATFAGTAVLLVWKRADDWMALFTSATLLVLIYLFGFGLDMNTIRYPEFLEQSLPIIRMLMPSLTIVCLIGLFFLFPDGRFYPRWSAAVAIIACVVSITALYKAFFPSSEIDSPFLSALTGDRGWSVFVFSLISALVVGLVSRIFYYRRLADETQRQQIKLVLFGLAIIIATPFLQSAIEASGLFNRSWHHFVQLHVQILLPIILPLTIGMSALRYRLWEVDLLINRTLVYGLLTAVLFLLYGLAVGLAGAILPTAVDWFLPLLSLGVIIVTVRPLRDRLQQWADRLLPVQVSSNEGQEAAGLPSSWPMRLLQLLWLALVLVLIWQVVSRLADFDGLLRSMRQEWIVAEVTRGISAISAADLTRLIALSELWNLAISWVLAVFVFWRRRNVWMGLFVSYLLLIMPFGVSFGTYGRPLGGALSFAGIALLVILLFIFPDGRFVPRSQKSRLLLATSFFALMPVSFALAQIVWAEAKVDEQAYFSFIMTLAGVMIAGIGSQAFRYRRLSDGVQRRQTRWVLLGLSMRVAWFVYGAFWLSLGPDLSAASQSMLALITIILSLIASAALPLSIAVAIVYDRLWQMDLVLNRTLVFGGLTALVIVLYVLIVGILSALMNSGNSLLLSVLATGLIAVLFNPLRQRLQRGVNRLLYGQRDEPLAVIAELGRRLESTAVPAETLPIMVATIAQTLKLPFVSLVGNELSVIATAGSAPEQPSRSFALVYQAQVVGQLLVAPRSPREQFTADEEHLLRNIARQAGAAVYAFQLMGQLQRSRERLVTLREEERRRLRRDLHDGLGPQLATLTVKVNAAENLLERDPEAARKLLAEVRAESQSAIQEVRRVVEDLRPSALDQLGLISALREFAAQHNTGRARVIIRAPDTLPSLPAAVEVAAYRIVTEALTNTRHAQAQNCYLTLDLDEELHLEIVDDGRGFAAPVQPGVGLTSMRERATELGGTFEVLSVPGQGTKILVNLPLVDSQ